MTSETLLRTVFFLFLAFIETPGREFMRVCYFTNWSHNRASQYAKFAIKDIDPSLCSHLVYAFAKVDADSRSIIPIESDEDPRLGNVGRFIEFNNLKNDHPHLTTLLSVGGEYASSDTFANVVSDDDILSRFAKTTVEFLRKRHFDGLDIDWEYPNATTKPLYTKLLKTLRAAFDDENTSNKKLLLTAALPAGQANIDAGFDVESLGRFLDFANLMTYDYHGPWNNETGFNSPLFSRLSNRMFNPTLSTDWTVQYYRSRGLPLDKIVVGVTPVGRRFKLLNATMTDVGAPVDKSAPPSKGDFYLMEDRRPYPEMCRVLQSSQITIKFDEEQKVPYAFLGTEWYGYDDPKSVGMKVNWTIKQGLAGVMFWSLDLDDFTGKACDTGRYPVLKALGATVQTTGGKQPTRHVDAKIRYLYMHSGGMSALVAGPRWWSWAAFLLVLAHVVVAR